MITIDPLTGVGTLIGPTNDAGAANHLFRDATFDTNLGLAVGVGGPAGTCNLRSFDLTVMARYVPEYAATIRASL